MLFSVRLGVTTSTVPVVAPVGTVAVINEAEITVNVVAVPLKVTLVEPVRFVPRISIVVPTVPPDGSSFTKGGSPIASLNTVPSAPLLLVPPS